MKLQLESKKIPEKKSTSASLTTLKPLTVWITTNCRKLLKRWEYQHLTCLLRNLYAGQEAIEAGMEQWTGSKLGKEYVKAVYCLSPCSFNLYANCILQNTGLDEAQAGIKIAGRNISNLRYTDDTTLMTENEEEFKSLLMKVKEESEKLA